MTERQLINAIKKAISENGIEYDASDLKNNLREDPDAIYDVMIGFPVPMTRMRSSHWRRRLSITRGLCPPSFPIFDINCGETANCPSDR